MGVSWEPIGYEPLKPMAPPKPPPEVVYRRREFRDRQTPYRPVQIEYLDDLPHPTPPKRSVDDALTRLAEAVENLTKILEQKK